MAGAGYKLYNTGDVLTAADVNTYLQQQTVMVFASSAARTSALSGVLAEGMLSYLTDTDLVQYYNGTAWTTINTDQTPLTTKGDLFTFSTTDARLAVGNNGETLVADSSATTGLRWQGNFAAGKNAILNADFNINQRNLTSTTTNNIYGFDRWTWLYSGGTATWSAQTFTAGAAPVAGYESKNFSRIVTSGQSGTGDYAFLGQRIESVRTFAGQTVTISFWAKASTGTPKVGISLEQSFGSGGSGNVIMNAGNVTISSSWARYSLTVAIPSISGKTIGTGDFLILEMWTSAGSTLSAYTAIGIQNATIDIWGVQVEAGSVATAFQTATGTLAGELAACQRYYYRFASEGKPYAVMNLAGYFESSIKYIGRHQHPVAMRTNPTTLDYANLSLVDTSGTFYAVTAAAIDTNTNTTSGVIINCTVSGATTSRFGSILINNNTGAYLGIGAEL